MACCEILLKRVFNISGDTPLAIPRGWFVEKIVVKSTTPQTIKLGTTVGGDEILLSTLLIANEYLSVTQDILPVGNAPVVIYPSGVTDPITIIVYRRKL